MARRSDGIYLWESRGWERQGMARKFAIPAFFFLSMQHVSSAKMSELVMLYDIVSVTFFLKIVRFFLDTPDRTYL